MANTSILAAFERMWQHIVTALAKKSDVGHAHSNATQSTSGFLSAEDKTQLDNGGIPIVVATSSNGVSYSATVDGIASLTNGMKITIIPNANSTDVNVKLNVNGLGDKYLRMPVAYNSTASSAGALASWIGKNKPLTLEYDGTYWKTISMPRPSALYLYGTVPIASGGTGATTAAGALTNLGITATASELNKLDGVTATTTELNYVDGVTSNIQTQLNGKTKKISLGGQVQKSSFLTSVIALCIAPTTASDTLNSYSSGRITFQRKNALYAPNFVDIAMAAAHGGINRVRTRFMRYGSFMTFKPCTFKYNNVVYGGIEVKIQQAEAQVVEFNGSTTFDIFGLDIYNSETETILNEEVYNSISYDNVIIETGVVDGSGTIITTGNIGSQSVEHAISATKIDKYVRLPTSGFDQNRGKYIKFGTITLTKAWEDCSGYFLFTPCENTARCGGILNLSIRTESTIERETATLRWLALSNDGYADSVCLVKTANGVFDLYVKNVYSYENIEIMAVFGATENRIVLSRGSEWVDITPTYESSIASVSSTCTGNASSATTLTGLTATIAELNYVDGVTSNIQTQLNGKAPTSHTHSYAGSSSVGGAATSANKLNTDAGSATQPVYFANGIPVKTTYTLGKSVPSDAKFTDTTYSVATTSANGLMSSTDKQRLDSISSSNIEESNRLFTTGDVKITNHDWNSTESNGEISIGVNYANNTGGNYTVITNDGLKVRSNAGNDTVEIKVNGITYNGQTLTWETLFQKLANI